MKNHHRKIADSNNVRKLELLGEEANNNKQIFRKISKNTEFALTMHHVKYKPFHLISWWENAP